jgi:hypothetical protein
MWLEETLIEGGTTHSPNEVAMRFAWLQAFCNGRGPVRKALWRRSPGAIIARAGKVALCLRLRGGLGAERWHVTCDSCRFDKDPMTAQQSQRGPTER